MTKILCAFPIFS